MEVSSLAEEWPVDSGSVPSEMIILCLMAATGSSYPVVEVKFGVLIPGVPRGVEASVLWLASAASRPACLEAASASRASRPPGY